jgi:putative endonuclease
VRIVSAVIFGMVDWAARKGLSAERVEEFEGGAESSASARRARGKAGARRTGIRGETYAYWYLRRHGYVIVARNYLATEAKGEADLVGYDGEVLAFIEVKTRSAEDVAGRPEEAVRENKRRNLNRMARSFIREARVEGVSYRFDVLAIETRPGQRPKVRLHKGAFVAPAGPVGCVTPRP